MENNKKNNELKTTNKQIGVVQSFEVSSPLPPPEWLEKYKQINPNIINELLEQYKINSEHLRSVDNKQLNLIKISQNQAFIFSLFCLICAVVVAYFNHDIVASTMMGTCILGAIKALIRK